MHPPIRSAADVRRIEAAPYAQYQPHASVHDALAAGAVAFGARPALRWLPDAELATPAQDCSHAQLLDEVRRAANLFHALAEGAPPRVALLLPAIPQGHIALWGAETAGVACPINYLLDVEHIAGLIDAAGCNLLVALGPQAELEIWPRVAALRRACPGLRAVLTHEEFDARRATQRGDALDFQREVGAGTLAALFHTGGTTGAPKLAPHSHGNQLHSAMGAALMYGTRPDDLIVNAFPIFHVAGSIVFGLSTLLAGGCVLLPTLLGLRNPAFVQRYWSFAQRERVTLVTATPTGIATLLNAPQQPAQRTSVRMLLTGGAPLPGELAAAFEQATGIGVRNTFGMTESAGVVSIEPCAGPRTPGACGLPIPFTEVAVRPFGAAEGEPDAAPGRSGILRLRGPNVSAGYTDAARNPGTFEHGWLSSGDIGHLDDEGRVFLTGRAKDVIIRNSHNIDPGLIEDALMRHPAVQLAAAVGEPDAYAGEVPVAYVVPKPGAALDLAELQAFVQPLIAERPAWPKRLERLDALPQTAVGKVYKPALRLRAIEHALAVRIAAAGLAGRVLVRGEEGERGLAVVFEPRGGATAGQLESPLRALMQPYALAWRLANADD